jgi:hypothetical protein
MQEREKQLDHYDALDTKAGVLLAFAGVLIVVARGIQFAYLLPGTVFASLSAALSLATFWLRKFPTLDPWELRQFLTYDTEAAGLKVHDTIAAAVSRGAPKLRNKARCLNAALILLLLAAITFGIGILSTAYSAMPFSLS